VTDGEHQIVARLDTLIRLVAAGVGGDRPQVEKIAMLSGAGLQPKAIAEILGTTSNTVSVALSNLRKQVRGSRRNTTGGMDDGA
jgi:hypothetical protein